MKKLLLLLTVFGAFYTVTAQKPTDHILHKVEAKETLYSLVKRYNTNFATVETLNPFLVGGNADIKIGQIIKFPKNNPDNAKKPTVAAATKTNIHEVQANETVYSISKKYNVDISNLVEGNNITSNTIKVGQKLIVDSEAVATIATKSNRPAELRIASTGKNFKETGLAEIISSESKSTKYLALHRTAPIGTNIKITNEATGHTVVAKVIGNLNKVGPDQNIMIKLSPYAYYQLRPKDSRLRATVEYYLPGTEDVVIK